MEDIPSGGNQLSQDTVFVEIYPPWGMLSSGIQFNEPRAILVGNDELFYVADYGNDRVLILNAGGQVLAARSFRKPTALAQDTRLDLLVAAEVQRPNGDIVGAIMRVHIVRDRQGNYYRHEQFATVPVETVWTESAWRDRRFTGLTVLPGNQYLAARVGPNNSSFIDPDARILLFNPGDTPIPRQTPEGV